MISVAFTNPQLTLRFLKLVRAIKTTRAWSVLWCGYGRLQCRVEKPQHHQTSDSSVYSQYVNHHGLMSAMLNEIENKHTVVRHMSFIGSYDWMCGNLGAASLSHRFLLHHRYRGRNPFCPETGCHLLPCLQTIRIPSSGTQLYRSSTSAKSSYPDTSDISP